MDHDGARNLMAVAVEGGLAKEQEEELALHLVGCTECRTLYGGLETAHIALGRLSRSHPPTRAVDEAIHRATTVLRGEADPGPMARAPAIPPPAHLVRPGHLPEADAKEAEPEETEPPALPPEELPVLPTEAPPSPVELEPAPEVVPPAAIADTPAVTEADVAGPLPSEESEPARAGPELPPELPPIEPADQAPPPRLEPTPTEALPTPPEWAAAPPEPVVLPPRAPPPPEALPEVTEVPQPIPDRPHEPHPRAAPGLGPWLGAIAATVVLALLAGYLISRGQGLGGGDAPSPDEVRGRVARLFTEMKSLKASFTIRRLDLYPVGRSDGSLQYSFSDGEISGRIVYDRAEGYREQTTVRVGGRQISRTQTSRTSENTQTLEGTGADAQLVVETSSPLGPPDAPFRPSLGTLERSVSTAAAELADASDLEVLGVRTAEEREVIEVRFSTEATELSRADVVAVLLDARTYFPVLVRREITRANAPVLGPEDVLTDNAIATAFGTRDRITTEIASLSDVVVDDIILPGDLVLDTPEGVRAQDRNGGYQVVRRADAAGRLEFTPLYPRTLPSGFDELQVAVFAGEPGAWGPNNSYPAPDGVMHATYFDGNTTVTIVQRHMPGGSFDTHGSPLQTGGLPVATRSVERAAKTFFYGWSPEVPPHAYGFLGNTFAVVSGYLPADELIAIVSSLAEAPAEAPADADVLPGSPSPPAPTASP